jgi:hypothetical protein
LREATGLLKAYGILFALIGVLSFLPQAAHAQAIGSTCSLERAIDFLITQDNGDFVDLKLSAGEVLRMIGGDAESRRVLWGNYESVVALITLMESCEWTAPGKKRRVAQPEAPAVDDSWSSSDLAKEIEPQRALKPQRVEAAPAPVAVPEAASHKILVFPLNSDGVPEKMSAMVTTHLVREIRKLEDVTVLTMNMLPAIIAERFAKCSGSGRPECFAGVAQQSEVNEAVLGTLKDTAEGRTIELKRIQREGSVVLGNVNESLDAGDNAAFLRVLGPSVEKLFSGQALALGRVRGVRADVLAMMNPPPIPSWATYLVGGIAVAAGGAAGAMGYLAKQEETRFNSPEESGPYQGSDFVDIQNRGTGYQQLTHALFIGGGVALIASGIMAFFTDWDGFPEPE